MCRQPRVDFSLSVYPSKFQLRTVPSAAAAGTRRLPPSTPLGRLLRTSPPSTRRPSRVASSLPDDGNLVFLFLAHGLDVTQQSLEVMRQLADSADWRQLGATPVAFKERCPRWVSLLDQASTARLRVLEFCASACWCSRIIPARPCGG